MRAPLYSPDPAEIFSSVLVEDPYPFFARLRERGPVTRIGETGVHWVATWSAIEEALEREDDFSANLTGVLVRGDDGLPATFAFPGTGASQVIATADEPDHATHRALVQPRLVAGPVADMEPRLRTWTREVLEPWLEDGGGEFTPIAEVVPARVVAEVLGLPQEDVDLFRRWENPLCAVAVYRPREAMSDRLSALKSEDAIARSAALNDRAHQELQIELDREHANAQA